MANDIERALAVLALEHKAVDPVTAWKLISDVRAGATPRSLVDLVADSVAETDLVRAVAAELRVRFYDMHAREQEFLVDERTLRRCDPRMLSAHAALPLLDKHGKVTVAMANPADVDIVQYLRTRFPEGFSIVLSPKQQVLARLLYLASDLTDDELEDANVVPKWVERLVERAVAEGASDIHFRFLNDESLLVRFRVDGVLRQVRFPLKGRELEVIASVMAKCETMDSSNMREAQDGTFSFQAGGRQIDARVNMLPQITGPNVTVRILDSQTLRKRPEEMGFDDVHLRAMREAITSPQGCVIVVGPTGSGKTTTLYALLREVDAVGRNVLTVEDPVEYRLPFIGQTQIRNDLGDRSLTFAKALRAIVRADPDVILVGEVRDTETAKVAMDAAITGHLVLTTLHARTAPGAYMRLSEMDVPRFLVAEAVSLIISQRLVRRIHECAVLAPPTADERKLLERWGITGLDLVPHATGCGGCNGLGFRGRLAVAEVLAPTPEVREVVAAGRSRADIVRACQASGWSPILADGLRHLRAGRTTIAELARVLSEDDPDDDGSDPTPAELLAGRTTHNGSEA